MFESIAKRLFGSANERFLKTLQDDVVAINSLVLNGLVDLQGLLNVTHKKAGVARTPTVSLFKVHAELVQAGTSSDVLVCSSTVCPQLFALN